MKHLIGALLLTVCYGILKIARGQQPQFEQRIVKTSLEDPWSISCDDEGYLWVTESKSYKILRVCRNDGVTKEVADLSPRREFSRHDTLDIEGKPWPQGGLMGLAIHPDLLSGKPLVFVAYVYKHNRENNFVTRISCFRFDMECQLLVDETVIDDNIPGSNDHNGGRLVLMNQQGRDYLFYAVGDMGAGQYGNAARKNYAQDPLRKEGKVLRYLLQPSEQIKEPLAWVPEDNPFNLNGRSAIYSVGHRNPQGLAVGSSAKFSHLYSCEHGPMSDDEVNIVESGKNYGHPLIVGYADGNYDGLSAAVSEDKALLGYWNTSLPLIANEKQQAAAIGPSYSNPIYSFHATSGDSLRKKFELVSAGRRAEWKSIAPSSLIYYGDDAIPEWTNSLLITALKTGAVYRLPLSSDGRSCTDVPQIIFENKVRYRDICVAADGKTFYLTTDRSAVTSGPTAENPKELDLRGCIIEFQLVN